VWRPTNRLHKALHLHGKETTMKKGYWVVSYRSISDESAVKAYGALVVPALESFGARLLTSSASQVRPHEAGLQLRSVLVEFNSYDIALEAYESKAYQSALQALGSGAERDFRIVEGA
jgi:uncharacterized protein (DUF1330 family)